MQKQQGISTILIRVALAAGFLSAVASRLGFWGIHSSGWTSYLAYVKQVNSFAPAVSIPILAVGSTILETSFAILLLVGYKIRLAAIGSSFLALLFALAMTISFGVKEPLDYSVFAFSGAAFLLSTVEEFPWSLDKIFQNKNRRS
jgi:putative oxidoreductase